MIAFSSSFFPFFLRSLFAYGRVLACFCLLLLYATCYALQFYFRCFAVYVFLFLVMSCLFVSCILRFFMLGESGAFCYRGKLLHAQYLWKYLWYWSNIAECILHQPAFGTSARLSLTEEVRWLYRCWGKLWLQKYFSSFMKLPESLREPYSPWSYTSAF